MTYKLSKRLITQYKVNGQTEKLEAYKDKLDVFFAAGRLTEAEYKELLELMQ
jgi:hypothetical protein